MSGIGRHQAIELRVSRDPRWPTSIEPVVGGVGLVDRVAAYERDQGYEPAGDYGGLVPAHFRFGDLTTYFRGEERRQSPGPGRLWLLGCDCGEVGCWPLEARVTVAGESVTWSEFRQPFREAWSYEGFGPFVFHRPAYDDAVARAVAALDDGSA